MHCVRGLRVSRQDEFQRQSHRKHFRVIFLVFMGAGPLASTQPCCDFAGRRRPPQISRRWRSGQKGRRTLVHARATNCDRQMSDASGEGESRVMQSAQPASARSPWRRSQHGLKELRVWVEAKRTLPQRQSRAHRRKRTRWPTEETGGRGAKTANRSRHNEVQARRCVAEGR